MKHFAPDFKLTRTRQNAIFIIGITPRCGTNYLYQLLLQHPDCGAPWTYEDYLVAHADQLVAYAESVYGDWFPDWGFGADTVDLLCGALGDGILSFLKREDAHEKFIVTKTPDSRNLPHFHRVFPQAKLVLLVRDGRDVVESARKSFKWGFEQAAHVWADGAQNMLAYMRQADDNQQPYLLVRYEDLFLDTAAELDRIMDFIGLDSDAYDFAEVSNLPVIGSSSFGQAKSLNGISFQPVTRTASFNPLKRWAHWDDMEHVRFNRICARYLQAFGYLDEPAPRGIRGTVYRLAAAVLDAKYTVLKQIRRTSR